MPDLSANQMTAVQTLMERLCPSLGLALSEQINCEAALELLEVRTVALTDLLSRTDHVFQTPFTCSQPEGSEGVFVLSEQAGRIFVDRMEGISGGDLAEPLSDPQVDTLSAAMAGLVRGLSAGLDSVTGEHYDIEPGATQGGALIVPPVFALEVNAIEVSFSAAMPDALNVELFVLFTGALLSELIPGGDGRSTDTGTTENLDDSAVQSLGQDGGSDGFAAGGASAPTLGIGGMPAGLFPDLSGRPSEPMHLRGLDMILDIPLDVTVELGRVRMLIKDVLELSSGSIIELDRVAGEPVDLLVNGRLVAKGEVVVIEDNFGIRITEIVSPAERVAGLGKGDRR